MHSRFDANNNDDNGELSDGMISQALSDPFLPDLDNFDHSKSETFFLKYFAVADSLSDSRIRAVILDIWNDLSKRERAKESQQKQQQAAAHSDAGYPRKQLSLLKKKQEERLSSPLKKASNNPLFEAKSRSRLGNTEESPKDKETKRRRSQYSSRHVIMPRRVRSTPTVRTDQDFKVSDSSFELKANRQLQSQFVGRPLPVVREEVDSALEETGGGHRLHGHRVFGGEKETASSSKEIQASKIELQQVKPEKDAQSTQAALVDSREDDSSKPGRGQFEQPQSRAAGTISSSEEYCAKEVDDNTEDCETSSLSSGSTSSYVFTRLYNNLADMALTTSSPTQSRVEVAYPVAMSPKLNGASTLDPICSSKMQLLRSALEEEATRILAQGEKCPLPELCSVKIIKITCLKGGGEFFLLSC